MSHRNYVSAGFAAAAILALAVCAVHASSALAAGQTVTNSNAKPGKKQPVSPSSPAAVVRQGNSNKSAQQQPPAKGGPLTSQKTGGKGDAKMAKLPPHQYVITSSDTGHYHTVVVYVKNEGKGPSKAGIVRGTVVYLEEGGDPRKSKILGTPDFFPGGPFSTKKWFAKAVLPPLKPGESAEVVLVFLNAGPPKIDPLSPPPSQPHRLGVSIIAINGGTIPSSEGIAYFKDFLSPAFFKK